MSKGHQRLFADGERILYIDKTTLRGKPVGVGDAFVRKDVNTVRLDDGAAVDRIEDEWSARENIVLPHARRLLEGSRTEVDREALKGLAAMCFARGSAFQTVHEELIEAHREELAGRFEDNPDALRIFETEYGRPPHPGELTALASDRSRAMQDSRELYITSVINMFNQAFEILAPHRVQLVWPASQRLEFVIGDSPLILWHTDGRVSPLEGLALREAERVFMPVGRRLLALFTHTPFEDCPLTDEQVVELNRHIWRASFRFVGAHPSSRVKYCLGRHDLVIER